MSSSENSSDIAGRGTTNDNSDGCLVDFFAGHIA